MSSSKFGPDDFDSSPELALQEVSTTDRPAGEPSLAALGPAANRSLDAGGRKEALPTEAIVQRFENPSVDILESDEVVVFSVDLPGMEEKDVDVWINRDTLKIRGQRTLHQDGKTWHLRERCEIFERLLLIPEGVDTDDTSMQFRNGVLTIRISKISKRKRAARRIQLVS